jgi:hypothetical protein
MKSAATAIADMAIHAFLALIVSSPEPGEGEGFPPACAGVNPSYN